MMESILERIQDISDKLSIIANNDKIMWLLDIISNQLNQLIADTGIPVATKIGLALPEIYKGGIFMANLQLKNDEVMHIGILTLDNVGGIVPAAAGDVFSVVSSNPASLNAVIGTMASGAPAVVINALVQESPGLTFTVSDSAGLAVFTETVDIVIDTTPTAMGLDLTTIETSAQPVPTNVGP
jgi:hypothetical protein